MSNKSIIKITPVSKKIIISSKKKQEEEEEEEIPQKTKKSTISLKKKQEEEEKEEEIPQKTKTIKVQKKEEEEIPQKTKTTKVQIQKKEEKEEDIEEVINKLENLVIRAKKSLNISDMENVSIDKIFRELYRRIKNKRDHISDEIFEIYEEMLNLMESDLREKEKKENEEEREDRIEIKRMKITEIVEPLRDIEEDVILLSEPPVGNIIKEEEEEKEKEEKEQEEEEYMNNKTICRKCGEEAESSIEYCNCPCHSEENVNENGDTICEYGGYDTDEEEEEESCHKCKRTECKCEKEEFCIKCGEEECECEKEDIFNEEEELEEILGGVADDLRHDNQKFLLKNEFNNEQEEYSYEDYALDEKEMDDENELDTTFQMILDSLNILYEQERFVLSMFFPNEMNNIPNPERIAAEEEAFFPNEMNNIPNPERIAAEEEAIIPNPFYNSIPLSENIKDYISFNDFSEFRRPNSIHFLDEVPEEMTVEDLEFYFDSISESLDSLDKFVEEKKKEALKRVQEINLVCDSIMKYFYEKGRIIISQRDSLVKEIDQEITKKYPFIDDFEEIEGRIYEANEPGFGDSELFEDFESNVNIIIEDYDKVIKKLKTKYSNEYEEWEAFWKENRNDYQAVSLIRKEQQEVDLIIPPFRMEALIKEISQDYAVNINFTDNAFKAIQTAAEAFLIQMMSDSNRQAIHSKKTFVNQSDMHEIEINQNIVARTGYSEERGYY